MSHRQSTQRSLVCIGIISIATFFMADSTWLTWPDAIYDFGSQLYYPWQMVSGKHLYTDIAYFNGPLSQYFNAAMFVIFGVSLRTLIGVNLAIVLGVIALIFQIISRLSDVVVATFACVVFVLVFAFGHYVGIGNYNWICPYTHEVTHGVALSLAMIAAMGALLATDHRRWLVLSGALLGLVFLTKAEVFVPAAGAAGMGLLLWGRAGGHWRVGVAMLLASAVAVVLIAFAFIAMTISSPVALRAVVGSWPWVFDRRIAQLQFYRRGLGIDDLGGNLWKMAWIGLISAGVFATVAVAGVLPKKWQAMAMALIMFELVFLIWFWPMVMQIARPWPVFVALIAAISIRRAWTADKADQAQWALRAMLSILALGLLGKMLLNARFWQYGFALAMPAAIVLIEALLGWIPEEITRRGGDGRLTRRTTLVVLTCTILCIWANRYQAAQVSVATGADQFFPNGRGNEVSNSIKCIDNLIPRQGTMAVMPQGLMLNYLTRRPDPDACVNLMPPEVLSIGEDRVVSQLNAHPPDLIVLSEKDIRDGAFVLTEGEYHYGQKIVAWVLNHYHRVIPADENSQLKLSFWIRSLGRR